MDPKSPWTSKTMWGGVFMLVALILGLFGVNFTEEQQAHTMDVVLQVVQGLGTLVGPIMVIWGRKTADAPISFRKLLPVILVASSCLTFTGCSATTKVSAASQVVLARQVYTTTLQTLTTFKTMGAIDAPTYEKIEISRKAASVALDAAEKAALEGGTQFDTAMDALDAALDALIAWRAQMEAVP